MADLTTASFPHLKPEDRKKILGNYQKLVNPQNISTIQDDREKLKKLLGMKSKYK